MSVSVGRIVHYIGEEDDADCVAAIVTKVDEQTGEIVDLVTFPPGKEPLVVEVVQEDKDRGPNTWHWPELVL